MRDSEPPHRRSSSRHTYLTERHAIHAVEDTEHRQEITSETDPNEVLEFMQNVVSWYESDVADSDELPVFAIVKDDGYVYIRDRQGGEYVMWSVNEWTGPKPGVDVEVWNKNGKGALEDGDSGINPSTLRAVINAIKLTYEQPSTIKTRFDRVQVESCPV